jgi:hypothetical protein
MILFALLAAAMALGLLALLEQVCRRAIDAELIPRSPMLLHSRLALALFPAAQSISLSDKIVQWHAEAAGLQDEVDLQVDDLSRPMAWFE